MNTTFVIHVLCLIILYDSFLRSFSKQSVYYLYNNGTSSIHGTYPWDLGNKTSSSTPASPINKSVAHIKQKKSFKSHLSANVLYFKQYRRINKHISMQPFWDGTFNLLAAYHGGRNWLCDDDDQQCICQRNIEC